jgi:hypothetical protein
MLLFVLAGVTCGAELSPELIRELDAAIAQHRQGTLIIEASPGTEVVGEDVPMPKVVAKYGFFTANTALPPAQRKS